MAGSRRVKYKIETMEAHTLTDSLFGTQPGVQAGLQHSWPLCHVEAVHAHRVGRQATQLVWHSRAVLAAVGGSCPSLVGQFEPLV